MAFIAAGTPTLVSVNAMNCLVPDGGGVLFVPMITGSSGRSMIGVIDILESLKEMPWSWRNKAQEGKIHRR
jgi:hypothetical protein